MKTAATVGAIGAGVYVGYLGVLAYAAVKDGAEDVMAAIKQTAHDVPISFWNWTAGSKSVIDPETGVEYIVPKTVTDANGTVIENPGWTVPIGGGLTYLGMWIGNRLNPVTAAGYNPNLPPEPVPSAYGPHVPGHPDHAEWEYFQMHPMATREQWLFYKENGYNWYDSEEAWKAQEEGAEWDESDVSQDVAESGVFDQQDYFVLIPDDPRRPMTLIEWGVWTFRNQQPMKNDVTDSGIPISSTMLHSGYLNWYAENVVQTGVKYE